MKYLLLLLTTLALHATAQISLPCLSQQEFTVVILGSSTAAGTGPSVSDSAWVNRYRVHLQSINPNNQVINLAQGGYTTYASMPTTFVPPAGRPNPDPTKNVDAALSNNPDAIIINYPSNDASNGFGGAEQMGNFDSIVNYANSFGVPVWVCTTQPKTSFGPSQDLIQTGVRDSIHATYGAMAIDFWTTIATTANDIDPLYDADGTHLNDAGHAILVSRVIDADILSALYEPPTIPNYFASQLLDPTDWNCASGGEIVSLIYGNAGLDDSSGYITSLHITNTSTGSDSLYTQTFNNGLSSCSSDTVQFSVNLSEGGSYTFSAYITNPSDTIATNDTIQLTAIILAQPEIVAVNDTICVGDNALLQSTSLNTDTLYWYSDPMGSNTIGSGPFLTINSVSTDTTVFAQSVIGPLHYTDSINTNLNSSINWNGVMFDVVAFDNIVIDSLSCRINSTGMQGVSVYYCSGSHIGNETNAGAWTLLGTDMVTVNAAGDIKMLQAGTLSISANDTVGIYIMMQTPASTVSYLWSNNTQTFSSSALEVIVGSGADHNFGGSYFPRHWNGSIYAHYGFNPLGQCASDITPVSAIVSAPVFNLGNDTTISITDTLELSASGFSNYLWSSGETSGNYEFNASNFGVGIYTVYLDATDGFGCTASDTMQITVIDPSGIETIPAWDVQVYPNPTQNLITIESTEPINSYAVYSIAGNLIFESQLTSTKRSAIVDLQNLDSGVYLITITSGTGRVHKQVLKK